MANESELELAKQILAKLNAMDDRLAKIEGSVGMLNGKETPTSVESKLDDFKNVHKGLKTTFEQGFADIHKGLSEIREVNKNRWEGQKQKGQLN